MERIKVKLSVIVDAIDSAFSDWEQFYNVATGKIESVPDEACDEDPEEIEELCEKIDTSEEYVRLPSQEEIHEYSIMRDFAESRNSPDLERVLHGQRPFRRFKDTAAYLGLIDSYYEFRRDAFAGIARRWCEENEIPFEDDLNSEQILRIKHYEDLFDDISARVKRAKAAIEDFRRMDPQIRELTEYYESDAWKSDFSDDEAGKLPPSLKRGVLSEDGVFDLLDDIRELRGMTGEK